jgi:hypothetical protein
MGEPSGRDRGVCGRMPPGSLKSLARPDLRYPVGPTGADEGRAAEGRLRSARQIGLSGAQATRPPARSVDSYGPTGSAWVLQCAVPSAPWASKSAHAPRRYVASTWMNEPGGFRPFRPVRAGGTNPYGGPRTETRKTSWMWPRSRTLISASAPASKPCAPAELRPAWPARCPRRAPRAPQAPGRSADSSISPRPVQSAGPRARSAPPRAPRCIGYRPPRGASPRVPRMESTGG